MGCLSRQSIILLNKKTYLSRSCPIEVLLFNLAIGDSSLSGWNSKLLKCVSRTNSFSPSHCLRSRSPHFHSSAAAAKSIQSCPTLWDPIYGSPPGSPVPGILQARTLEWVAISFSNAWKWKVKSESEVARHAQLIETPWTTAHQAPPSMGFSRQGYWSGVPLPSPSLRLTYIKDFKRKSCKNLSHVSQLRSQGILMCQELGQKPSPGKGVYVWPEYP